ncbi:MAG: hypothetical protein A3B90_02425 [Candidatus Magasanikbacteria bacterium RIFCSPHIGHO2_02_FULL_41_13]|uniref:Uncharacterized protein n=1 Tax=Candidatus Magasanikbacteria bacterium RIFCSPHIGHO2_02_FULL_41_13 TaxID=1798676 RepID=A0A1F6M494_9BACT|nr:MAG: hypothetical protein A3B90_02425 [Candidatus Magasanikbacteria bacterium RIFCSPHIGHO2_02_FULL_41_13]
MSNPEFGTDEKNAAWHPPLPESSRLKTEVTVDELLKNVGGGWDEKTTMTGVSKESAQKLLKDAYQLFDAEYEKRDTEDNAAKLDNLEKVIDLLQAKRKEPSAEAVVSERVSEATVETVVTQPQEVGVETAAETPKETREEVPIDNVIDRSAEFRRRTEVNKTLTSATKLGVEMFGGSSALTQGDKILAGSKSAMEAIRKTFDLKQIDAAMRSEMIKSFDVLRSGIHNQIKEQAAKRPEGYNDLITALDKVQGFIAELKSAQASAETTSNKEQAA